VLVGLVGRAIARSTATRLAIDTTKASTSRSFVYLLVKGSLYL
jgi:hypothetical protein